LVFVKSIFNLQLYHHYCAYIFIRDFIIPRKKEYKVFGSDEGSCEICLVYCSGVVMCCSRREWRTNQNDSTWNVWYATSWNAGTRSHVSAVVMIRHHRPVPVAVLLLMQHPSLHR